MIFQDFFFQFFDIWDGIESGLYYAIVGFYFLIFAYFLLMRYRVSKKLLLVLFFNIIFISSCWERFFYCLLFLRSRTNNRDEPFRVSWITYDSLSISYFFYLDGNCLLNGCFRYFNFSTYN